MRKQILSNFALFLTALIWGLSFVAQKSGMDYVGPYTFNAVRSFLGGVSLLPLIGLIKAIKSDHRPLKVKELQHILLLKGGIVCGAALFFAITIQQYCMQFVSAGKAGFISALYIIFVPLIGLFFGKKLNLNVKISVLVAVIGLYLLCFRHDISQFSIYDGVLLISAFFYGVHILVVNHYSQRTDAAKLSCIQFFTVAVLSLPLMLIYEQSDLKSIYACRIPLLFAGILTCGIAYTMQIFGQKHTPPAIASIILSLESVFAVLGGNLILHEVMSFREVLGCVFMISAVLLSKLSFNQQYTKTN